MIQLNRFTLISLIFTFGFTCLLKVSASDSKPNIVIIFLDDAGYSDFQPFDGAELETPHVAQLAAEGKVFERFYVPQAVCSASRAALMTGSYPGRTKVFGAHPPLARGLEPEFPVMSEVFKAAGYNTAFFGKWHLGDQEGTRPHDRGFDESAGLMFSNDMWKHHPQNPDYWGQFVIKYWQNGEVIIEDVGNEEQKLLTKWYTEKAVDFINRQKANEPFLLYVPHTQPHVPLFVSEEFEGKSGLGLYADVILELDWSVGQIHQAIKDNGFEDNTLILFSSDNGPWIHYGNHAGVTPFREAKATSFDGGTRSPCIIKYPPLFAGGETSSAAFVSIDVLPTLANLAGVPMPENEIDGNDVIDLLKGAEGATTGHDYYAFSTSTRFEAVMSGDGKWKLHLPHNYRRVITPGLDGMPGKGSQDFIELSLYNLEQDPYETINMIEDYPEVAIELMTHAIAHLKTFYVE